MNKLKGHFKNRLDWFTKGENTFIEDKWEGLSEYKYSIAIENSMHSGYFTEKITDCFLAGTMPFYWGCPDIKNFFDDRSFILIDRNDFMSSISIIEDAMKEELQKKNAPFINESRRVFLEKYHFTAALTNTLNKNNGGKEMIRRQIQSQIFLLKDHLRLFLRR